MNRPESLLRVVYYGPPGAGKTTNLQRIAALVRGSGSERLTARSVGENRLVSVDIPIGSLGPRFESNVVVRLETMSGEVSGTGDGWSPILADADGIVFVVDSHPHARAANVEALTTIRERLAGRGRSGASTPVLMQWNKRDCAGARTIVEMEMELNHRCFPSIEAVSLRGTGVAETLIEILKRTICVARLEAGGTVLDEADVSQAVDAAVERLSQLARKASLDRFGPTIELQREPEYSTESSARGMSPTASATRMLVARERATSALDDQNTSGPPRSLMSGLLAGCDRTRGSLLLFRDGTRRMEECEVVPAGSDPLNASRFGESLTRAAILCARRESVMIDRQIGLAGIRGALIVPLVFGFRTLGGLFVYVTDDERPPTAEEQAYWSVAANLVRTYLAWQAGERQRVESRRSQLGGTPPRIESQGTDA